MQCTIYALGEKKWRTSLDRVLVLARKGEKLILHRDELNALWELPEKQLVRGESKEEAARAALVCSASAATRGYRSFRGNCHERSLTP